MRPIIDVMAIAARGGVFNVNDARHQRAELRDKAEGILKAAAKSGKDLSAAQLEEVDGYSARVKELTEKIEAHMLNAVFPEQNTNAPKHVQHTNVDTDRFYAELGAFMRGTITASDTPLYVGAGAGVESVGATVPTSVLGILPAYANVDSFGLAGSRIIQTEDTTPLVLPVVSGGAAPSKYNEGSSSTESQPFQMDSFTLGGAKYSRLVKVSEEALMNSAVPLQNAILDELATAVASGFTTTITASLVAKLAANSDVLVAQSTNDIYHTLLGVMHAVPPRFALPTNKWMCSRATIAKIKDARTAGSGVPFFNPETGQIFGKESVINDNLDSGEIVYGDWGSGAIIRKSPFFIQVLREQYSGEGKTGFRATQYLDQHFLAELTAVPNQPLAYSVLS